MKDVADGVCRVVLETWFDFNNTEIIFLFFNLLFSFATAKHFPIVSDKTSGLLFNYTK